MAWALFWEVKETICRDRKFFLVRWMYSDKSAAKKIEVLPYLLTDEKVIKMLSNPEEKVIQPNQKELSSKNVNVVLRLRNLNGGLAWGRLAWKMLDSTWSVVDVHDIPSAGRSKKYADVVIPIGIVAMGRKDEPPDPISIKWDELYFYR